MRHYFHDPASCTKPGKLCYNCHEYGHISKDCTKPKQQRKQGIYNLIEHIEHVTCNLIEHVAKLNELFIGTHGSHKAIKKIIENNVSFTGTASSNASFVSKKNLNDHDFQKN